jgi:hypothetical protein
MARSNGVDESTQERARAPAGSRLRQIHIVTNTRAMIPEEDYEQITNDFIALLGNYGYPTDDCEIKDRILGPSLKHIVDNVIPLDSGNPNQEGVSPEIEKLALEERRISETYCPAPELEAKVQVFDAKLTLSVDSRLGNQRVVLIMKDIASSSHTTLTGGYARRPGDEPAEWYDMMSWAIDRTMKKWNVPTTISASLPGSARVGQTVHMDARNSWDADGDPFELIWKVGANVCQGDGFELPLDERECPSGTLARWREYASDHDQKEMTATFVVPMVGDYQVHVYARVTGTVDWEHGVVCDLRAYPRNPHELYVGTNELRLPRNFLESTNNQPWAILIRAGTMYRFKHRVSLVGAFADFYGSAFLGYLNQGSLSDTEARKAPLAGLETVEHVLNHAGRFGFSLREYASVGANATQRGNKDQVELLIMVSGLAGIYYSFGHNYFDRNTRYCAELCPTLTFGPTMTKLWNPTIHENGTSLGLELDVGASF